MFFGIKGLRKKAESNTQSTAHEHKWEPQEGLMWADVAKVKFPHQVYHCHCGSIKHEALDI